MHNKTKLTIDILMIASMFFSMSFHLFGMGVHKMIGLLTFILFTSNLDSLNEAVILRSLKEEQQGKTVVLVSHRESTMRIADQVCSVEHGRMS